MDHVHQSHAVESVYKVRKFRFGTFVVVDPEKISSITAMQKPALFVQPKRKGN